MNDNIYDAFTTLLPFSPFAYTAVFTVSGIVLIFFSLFLETYFSCLGRLMHQKRSGFFSFWRELDSLGGAREKERVG